MHNCELSVEREIDFITKYDLSVEEFQVIKFILLAQEGYSKYLAEIVPRLSKPFREILTDLRNKEIITKAYIIPDKGMEFIAEDVTFNKRFINSFYQHSQDLGQELFEKYPVHTTINGRVFSLRNIAKGFKSFDDFCFQYGKAIKFDPVKHNEIMELLEFAKDNNLIQSGLSDFVISRQWLTLQQYKDSDMGSFEINELI